VDRDGRSTKPDFFNQAQVMGVQSVFTTRSVSPPEWQVQASPSNHGQYQLPVHNVIRERQPGLLPLGALRGASFSSILMNAVMRSDYDQRSLAEKMHISEGYTSRFLKTRAEAWAKRIVRFMQLTNDLGALQWIANQMGCEVVVRACVEAELAAAKARVAELERHGCAA
jgi:hypothetical protein